MKGYTATIIESSRELTPIEKVKVKNMSNVIKLDEATQKNGSIEIDLDYFVAIQVQNEHAKGDKQYYNYMFFDKNGECYVTGSEPFYDSFYDIYSELKDVDGWKLLVSRQPSKNYTGKDFLTCGVI